MFLGAVEILLGAVLLLLVPISIAGAWLQDPGAAGHSMDARSLAVSAGLNIALATFFIVTGIATIRLRRWARTIMLSVTWLWLVTGLAAVLVWIVILPAFELPESALGGMEPPAGTLAVVKVLITLFVVVLYVALPAGFVLVLRSPSVRATFERCDPKISWTERVPGSVLSMTLTLAYLALTCLFLIPFGGVPFFGILLGPWTSAAVWVVSAALCAWLAHGFYRRSARAWWSLIAVTTVWTVSSVWTFLQVEPGAIWEAMRLPAEQAEMLEMSGLGSRAGLVVSAVLSGVTMIGYAVYLRRSMWAVPPPGALHRDDGMG